MISGCGLTVKNGMYRIATCMVMLNAIAATRYGFFHTGRTSSDSFSDSEFMALNISTVTRIDRLMVVARLARSLVNISHPISGNLEAHAWKWVYVEESSSAMGLIIIVIGLFRRTSWSKVIWGPPV